MPREPTYVNATTHPARELVLHGRFPARVVRRLPIRRVQVAELLAELARQPQRVADRLDEHAARNRVAQRRAREGQAVVVGDDDRRRLREARLVDVLEEIVVREHADAAAHHRAVVQQIRSGAARQDLRRRLVDRTVRKQQAAVDLEVR